MKRCKALCFGLSIILGLLAHSAICHAKDSKKRGGEVRIVILPPRAAVQEHGSVKSFRETTSHAEFASRFQLTNDAGLRGQWYFANQIPPGEYEVRVSIGIGKPDIVRVVRIESPSETLYFGSDVTTAHIVTVDPLGDILKNVVVDKFVDGFGSDYAGVFAGGASNGIIPSGIYQVQVHARGYGIATGKFCYCQPESWSVLGVGIPGGDTVYPDATVRLRGNIRGGGTINEPIIVRLNPAYMSLSMAAVILPGADGNFEVSGALPAVGDYVILASQSGHILLSSTLRLPLRTASSFRLNTGAVITIEADNQEGK